MDRRHFDIADDLHSVAAAIADAARLETLSYFRRHDLDVVSKAAAFDPVTEADKAAERAMRAVIEARRPEDGILGEEYDAVPSRNGLTWILDPIDGTRGFMSGTPTWGVLVALSDETGPVLGVIDQPYIRERFTGGLGRSLLEGPLGRSELAVRRSNSLEAAILFSTFPEIGSEDERARFARVADRVRLVRYGTDCYAYGLLAAGQIDLVIEAGLQPYDIAAPIAVIEAAGGIVTDWSGGTAHHGGQVLAAAHADLHAQALALLA